MWLVLMNETGDEKHLSLSILFFFFLRSPAISLGFTTLGEIFAYVTVF